MDLGSMKPSPLDPFSTILIGKLGSDGVSSKMVTAMIVENWQLLMILMTLIMVLVGCVIVVVWWWLVAKKVSRPVEPETTSIGS